MILWNDDMGCDNPNNTWWFDYRIDLHVTVQPTLPPLLAMSWIRPPHVHSPPGFSDYSSTLLKVFFLKKLPWQGGAGWLQRGAASPPFPWPGSESALKPPGNVTFPSLLSLSSRCSLHDLNPSFTVKPLLAPPFWKSLSLFSPSSHCFARPPLSSSLTFGSEERNSWSVRTRR